MLINYDYEGLNHRKYNRLNEVVTQLHYVYYFVINYVMEYDYIITRLD